MKFLSHGPGYDLFLTANEAVLRVAKPHALQAEKLPGSTAPKEAKEPAAKKEPASANEPAAKKETETEAADPNVRKGTVLRLKLLGANNRRHDLDQDA